MILTNNHNLPTAIYNAITRRTYSKGGADFSATGLHIPPQITKLLKEHGDNIEEDAADSLAALYGSIVHSILEHADEEAQAIREKRLFMKVDGISISGKFDRFLLSEGRLSDYKFVSIWQKIFGTKEEYEGQTNVYAELFALCVFMFLLIVECVCVLPYSMQAMRIFSSFTWSISARYTRCICFVRNAL